MGEKRALMNENAISLEGRTWTIPLSIVTLITLLVGAYSLVQSVLELVQYYEAGEWSMLVVIIFLLVTPLGFGAALLFAFGVHRIATDEGGDNPVILGFALMVLASVDNLIYVSIRYGSDAISFYILGGIELICYVIGFLYYQGLGPKALAVCAAVILVVGTALELEEAIRYFVSVSYYNFGGYYFVQTLLDLLLGVVSLLFAMGLRRQIPVRK